MNKNASIIFFVLIQAKLIDFYYYTNNTREWMLNKMPTYYFFFSISYNHFIREIDSRKKLYYFPNKFILFEFLNGTHLIESSAFRLNRIFLPHISVCACVCVYVFVIFLFRCNKRVTRKIKFIFYENIAIPYKFIMATCVS